MDCSIYEVSAVTAGGVARAGVLTEAFGRYSEGTDIGEFKKEAFADNKDVPARILFETFHVQPAPESTLMRISSMEKTEVEAMINAQFGTIVADKAKLEVEYKHLGEKFELTNTELVGAKAEIATLAAANLDFTAKNASLLTEKAGIETTFAAERDGLNAEKTTLTAYKDAYVAIVTTASVKVGKTVDHTTLDLPALQTAYTAYCEELNTMFPTGRQTTDAVADNVAYSGIPESVFKTDKA
jgi:hypothetical protein